MELFDGLETIITVLSEFVYDKAFDKSKKLVNRLPYLILYVLVLILIISGLIYLGIILINSKNIFIGIILLLIAILCTMILLMSFIKKK